MCWAEKFCYCVPLNLGCVLLGAINFVIATIMAIDSILYFESDKAMLKASKGHSLTIFRLEMTQVSSDIVLGLTLAVALSLMVFSVLLIMGIIRNKSSYVLAFFFYGIFLVIFGNLGALLIILRSCQWCLGVALTMFLLSLLYVHFLVAVYTVYELMQRGRDFRFHKNSSDDDQLLTAEDFN